MSSIRWEMAINWEMKCRNFPLNLISPLKKNWFNTHFLNAFRMKMHWCLSLFFLLHVITQKPLWMKEIYFHDQLVINLTACQFKSWKVRETFGAASKLNLAWQTDKSWTTAQTLLSLMLLVEAWDKLRFLFWFWTASKQVENSSHTSSFFHWREMLEETTFKLFWHN